ncbi:aldehyde dehydrogenase [Thalassospira marina]|uniref:Salicylaldehyde dehydrogenase n=1 Tax=Thalassospira marina TaxID=2048283 RepID=A0A2N3L045_9PROT|nr:aldehyde dehydrogenase [Thalassospira marina]PKR56090.1 salicylaldehyde dehydrogenase [Thalassospira marina]
MYDINLLINNTDSPASQNRTFERKNPVTGEVATRAAAATREDAIRAADAAASAFPAWSKTGPGARRAILQKAAEIMESKGEEFGRRVLAETGSTAMWGGFNAHLAANMLREAAAMTTQITGDVIPSDVPGSFAMGIRQPAGVVLGIAPWNAPVILGTRAIAMPLACGNTVILKASELCPAIHHLIGDCLREAGAPEGVVNVITNAPEDAPEIVEALIAHPAIRRINFTGSTRVGRIIAELAARHLKPVLLELGGKAPFLVLDDADLDEAVNAAAFGAYMNQGQICMSTERLIVDNEVGDDFAAKLAAKAKTLTAGDPAAGKHVLGGVVTVEATHRIEELVEDAIAKGAKLIAGSGKADGALMDATLLDHVTSSMRIYREESFGPVVCIMRANGDDEAIRIANDSEYGLSSAVFSQNITRAMDVARQIESGICHINGPTVHDEAQMPFGGVKSSGYGRFGGKAAIDEFTETRWMTIQHGKRHYPF